MKHTKANCYVYVRVAVRLCVDIMCKSTVIFIMEVFKHNLILIVIFF